MTNFNIWWDPSQLLASSCGVDIARCLSKSLHCSSPSLAYWVLFCLVVTVRSQCLLNILESWWPRQHPRHTNMHLEYCVLKDLQHLMAKWHKDQHDKRTFMFQPKRGRVKMSVPNSSTCMIRAQGSSGRFLEMYASTVAHHTCTSTHLHTSFCRLTNHAIQCNSSVIVQWKN